MGGPKKRLSTICKDFMWDKGIQGTEKSYAEEEYKKLQNTLVGV
jgi:hypothetical protein